MVNIFTDGGARGNPGDSAGAFVVYDGNLLVHEEGKLLGRGTNNNAEYCAVLMALEWVLENKEIVGEKPIVFNIDSQLVVKQIKREYKIKDENLRQLAKRIFQLIGRLNNDVTFNLVPREKNKEADAVVNKTLDRGGGK
jgi:ribonuclease HI